MSASNALVRRAVILTAIRLERMAVCSFLDDLHEEEHEHGTVYWCGRFSTPHQSWEIGVAQTGAGNPDAAAYTERAIAHFSPEVVLFVGVAGGVKDVQVGDVVVATKVYGFERGKAGEAGYESRPQLGQSTYRMQQRAEAEAGKPDWVARLGDQYPDPMPRVYVEPIVAGEKVVAETKSETYRSIRRNYSDAVAVEMEGIGFLTAAHASHMQSLIVRGISDLIDGKGEADRAGSQELAARHAAAFAFEVLAKLTPLQGPSQQIEMNSPPRPFTNLPEFEDRFIGRDIEMSHVRSLLLKHQMVTIVGEGGCGKSRLAREVGRSVADLYPDGVWLIELSDISDPMVITEAICSTLKVAPPSNLSIEEALVLDLRDKRMLLLLDNCEHLLDVGKSFVDFVDDLLIACPRLRLLATSQHSVPRHGGGEYRLLELPIPLEEFPTSIRVLQDVDSVRLFVARATEAQEAQGRPSLKLSERNALAICKICRELEGIPLAIELAASQLVGMPLQELERQLSDRLTVLKDEFRGGLPRHRALRETVEWSYHLLNAFEQAIFRRLSVFDGGWTIAGARAVCGGTRGVGYPEIAEVLRDLVHKSLVRLVITENDGRYRMLETLRTYAAQQLAVAGEEDQYRDRHLAWCLMEADSADRADTGILGNRNAILGPERGNLRSALTWSVNAPGRLADGVRLARILTKSWMARGYYTEIRQWLKDAIAQEGGEHLSQEARGWMRTTSGQCAFAQGDYAAARQAFEDGLHIFRAIHDQLGVANILHRLGECSYIHGEYAEAKDAFEDSRNRYHELDNQGGVANSIQRLGDIARMQGDHVAARQAYEDGLHIFRAIHDQLGVANVLRRLGDLSYSEADNAVAKRYFQECLKMYKEVGNRFGMASTLPRLGDIARRDGEKATAKRRYEEGLRISREIGDRLGVANALRRLGEWHYMNGDYVAARRRFEEGLRISREIGDRLGVANMLKYLGDVALLQCQPAEARSMLQECLEIYIKLGNEVGIEDIQTRLAGMEGGE